MARVSLRDWIEILLEPGESTERREALAALSGVKAPLVAEALQLAVQLEGEGPMKAELAAGLASLTTALGPKATALANDATAAPFRAVGTPFRPLGVLAAGADSRTYLSVQVGLRRVVGLKLLPPKLAANPVSRAAFLADARRQGRVLHPHIAGVIECGEAFGQPFCAVEQVDGQSLKQVIDAGGAVDWQTSARLVREGLNALAAIHRIDVTHGRLLLTTLLIDREERLKLTELAPSAGRSAEMAVIRDLSDLGLVAIELLTGAAIARPLTAPPPAVAGEVPPPLATFVHQLATATFTDAAQALEELDRAHRAIEAMQRASEAEAEAAAAAEVAAAMRETTPVLEVVAATPVRPEPVAEPPKRAPRRLMIVDDELNILELARMLLQPYDFEISTATNPDEALRLLYQSEFDCVLTDLNFPGGQTGVDLVTAMRAHRADLPMVAMSASQDADVWDKVLRQGVAGIVAKPLDTTELVAVIERAVSRKKPPLLLVDDSHLARRVFKRFFENRGFDVTVVAGVTSAIEALEIQEPVVVVTDLHLDDGTGVDVLQHVHDNLPRVRVIIMSAKPDADMVIRAHRLNVFDFVNKSEDPRYLLRSVEKVVIQHPAAAA